MKYLTLFVFLTQIILASTVDIENYLKKSDEILAILKKDNSSERIIGLEDKKMAKLFSQMAQIQPKITSQTYSNKDFGTLSDITNKVNEIQMIYSLHGIKSIVSKTDTRKDIKIKMLALSSKNFIKYQDELEITFPFMLDILAIQSKLIVPFWKSLKPKEKTKTRINGVILYRKGAIMLYQSVVAALKENKIKSSFKKKLLNSAKNASFFLSQLLTLNERKSMLNELIENKKTIADKYKNDYDEIIKAFRSTKCNAICKI